MPDSGAHSEAMAAAPLRPGPDRTFPAVGDARELGGVAP